jgi:hypothetical protein
MYARMTRLVYFIGFGFVDVIFVNNEPLCIVPYYEYYTLIAFGLKRNWPLCTETPRLELSWVTNIDPQLIRRAQRLLATVTSYCTFCFVSLYSDLHQTEWLRRSGQLLWQQAH